MSALKKAEKALEKDPKHALEPLIEAWLAQPSLEARTAVTQLEGLVSVAPFEGDTAAWLRAAKKPDAWTQSALLQKLRGPTIKDTKARLEAVIKWGPDPRTSRVLEEIVVELPWTSDSSKPLWKTIFTGITAMKDPRFVELAKSAPAKWSVRENIEGWLKNGLTRAAGKLTATPVEAATQLKALSAKLEALTPKKKVTSAQRDEAGLLADIYANPADDGPRLVYADWLLERGDPRGEFITLQFRKDKDAAALKREKALLKEHGRKWLGPLEPVVTNTFEFARGFLVKAETKYKSSTRELFKSPAWATVEEAAAFGDELHRIGLKRVTASSGEELLAAKKPWPFEQVTCSVADMEEFRQLLQSDLFPKLTKLRVSHADNRSVDSAKWLFGLKDVPAPELEFRANFNEPVVRWPAAANRFPTLEVLTIEDDLGTSWRWTRDADRRLSKLELRMESSRYPKETLARLNAIPGGWVTEFTLTGSTDAALLEAGRGRITAGPEKEAAAPAVKSGERPRLTTSDSFRQVAWSAEGWWLAEGDRIALANPSTGELVREFVINRSQRFAFTDDGKRVITANGSTVRAYSLATGKLEVTVNTGAGGTQDLKISKDGRFGLLCAEYHAYFFDLQTKKVLRKAKAKIYYSGAVSPDGVRFATPLEVHDRPNPAYDVIQVMDGKPGSRSVKFGKEVSDPAFLPDGRILCTNRYGHRLLIFDSVTGKEELVIEGGLDHPHLPVVSPTGKHASCWSDENLALLDLVKGKVLWQKKPADMHAPVAFSPDGTQLVVGCAVPEIFSVP